MKAPAHSEHPLEKPPTRPVVLTIAGFDPSSGAGITADIKTISAHNCFGVACITALTVQNTQGIGRIEPISEKLIAETLERLASDVEIDAIRVGMLDSGVAAAAVADFLFRMGPIPVVLDPVLKSSSGAELIDFQGFQVLKETLMRLAFVITPNLAEAAVLTGMPIASMNDVGAAARKLQMLGAKNIVITGGHLPENIDFLLLESGEEHKFAGQRIHSASTHGTGCAFATALACNLARKMTLFEGVAAAKEYVRKALEGAYPVGKGKGPLNHLFRLR